MQMDLFRKIVDEVATLGSVYEVIITGLGETTLDRDLVERVRYVHSKAPNLDIWVFTNGSHMTTDLYDKLVEAGLSKLTFSLNANTEEQHEKVMKLKGTFDRTCKVIDYAIAHKPKDFTIFVDAVADGKNFTVRDMDLFFSRWGVWAVDGYGLVVGQGNWADENCEAHPVRKQFKPNEWCSRSTGYIYVMYDGRVSACCFDPYGKLVFGDLNLQTLRDVYASDAYVAFRKAHVEDRADEYDICKNCTRA